MPPRPLQVVGIERAEQLERAALRREVLGVLEGQAHEGALRLRQDPLESPLDRLRRRGERPGVGRESARVAAKHVARELIEHHHQRERRQRRRAPALEPAARAALPQRKETGADLGVERV